MESSTQDRRLPASQRKLQKAREEGQLSRSKDLTHLLVLGGGLLLVFMFASQIGLHLRQVLAEALTLDRGHWRQTDVMLTRLWSTLTAGLWVCLPIGLVVGASTVAGTLLSGGWNWTFQPVFPQLNRINPLSGFARLFAKEHLAEIGKLILVIMLLLGVSGFFFANHLSEIALLHTLGLQGLRPLMDWLTHGAALLMLALVSLAVIDLPLQKFLLLAKLRMSLEEVKKEQKETDGDPHLKGRLRSRQREIAQRNSVQAVPKADFVVMNPTHYAVAVQYSENAMTAPHVVAKGADVLAFKIKEIAQTHAVPILQAPMLARALYTHTDLNQEIPASLYTAVAQVLAHVYRLRAALRGEGPMPGDCPEPLVPPEMDPLNRTASGATR